MIKSYSLFTSELDDNEAAVQDIASQLKEIQLRKNTIGLVACHNEFVESGIMKEVQAVLPFPLAGIVTFYQATPEVNGLFEMTITVLTSDDVRFACAGRSLEEGAASAEKLVGDAYQQAYAEYGETPSLIFSFMTLQTPISGDCYLRLLDAASGGVLSFGSLSAGETEGDSSNLYVICGEQIWVQGFAMVLCFGEVHPKFYFRNFRTDKLLEMTATVTDAKGPVVKEFNNQPAYSFMEKNGIVLTEEEKQGLSTIPFLHKVEGEKEFVARTLGGVSGAGEALFYGEVPHGAVMRAGTVTAEDIMDLSREAVRQAVEENPEAAVLLMFSCVGRFITLGLDTTSEMDSATGAIPAGMKYLACYAGGEMCPVERHGKQVNRFHNSSFIVCALQ